MFLASIIVGAGAHKLEYFGYSIYLVGIFLMFTDPFAVKKEGDSHLLLGDLIAFIGAGSGALLGYYNSKNTKIIHPITLYGQINFYSIIYQATFACIMLGPTNVLSFNTDLGMFGWLSDSSLTCFLLFIVAPFFGILNNVSFFTAYHYWPMEILAGVILMSPFVSQVVGIILGLDGIPGFRTLLGLTIVTIGNLIKSYGNKLKALETVEKICKEENIPSKLQMSILGSARKFSSGDLNISDSIGK